jgi:hypothetical protein
MAANPRTPKMAVTDGSGLPSVPLLLVVEVVLLSILSR